MRILREGNIAPLVRGEDGLICWTCWERIRAVADAEEKSVEILKNLDALVGNDLKGFGLSPREVRAAMAIVPRSIQSSMPLDVIQALAVGTIPTRGFGLGSDTGTGKTMAIASLIKGFQRARRKAFAARIVERAREFPGRAMEPSGKVVWLNWPDTVNYLRAHAIDGGAEDLLERAENAALLVLDDLGRERIKGSYVEDWAASQLDRIVNHRYREELTTIWTTNTREAALTGLYGAALLSRLTEDAPLIWLKDLPSLRVRA